MNAAIAGAAALLTSAAAMAQPAPEPFTDLGTLGVQLEATYTRLLSSCQIGPPKQLVKGFFSSEERPASAVPPAVQTSTTVDLKKRFVWVPNTALARAFAQVYGKSNSVADAGQIGAQFLLYRNGVELSAKKLQPFGTSSATFMHDCAGVVTAVANAKTNVGFPLGSLKSALSATYENNNRTTLVATFGRFESPFFAAWNSGATDEQTYAAMLLYGWYLRNPQDPEHKMIHTVLSGASIHGIEESNRMAAASIDAKSSGSFGIASGGLDGLAKMENKTSYEVKDFQFGVGVEKGEPDVQFSALPTISEVVQKVQSVLPAIDQASVYPAIPGLRNIHKVRIAGVGAPHCDSLNPTWKVESDGPLKPRVVGLNSVPPVAGEYPACELSVAVDVPAAYTAAPVKTGPVDLTYSVVSVRAMRDGSVLKFAPLALSFSINKSPEFVSSFDSVTPTYNVGDGFLWTTSVVVRETGTTAPLDWSAPFHIDNAQIHCSSGEPINVSASFKPNPSHRTGELRLAWDQPTAEQVESWRAGAANWSSCLAKGTLAMTAKGTALQRDIAVRVRMPSSKVAFKEPESTVASSASK